MQLVSSINGEKCYGELDDLFLIKKKSHKKNKSNIALAAAIAAKARIKLYKAQRSVVEHGGHLLYSDTDSIFASFHLNNNVENKLIGDYVYFDTNKKDTKLLDAVFISSKTYALVLEDLTEVVKIKGINTIDIDFKTIKDSFFNDTEYLTLKSDQFLKKNLELRHSLISKEINIQNYGKRIWTEGKTNTQPLLNRINPPL